MARYENIKLPNCEHTGPCNNCMEFALQWRQHALDALRQPQQSALGLDFTAPIGEAA